MLLIMRGLFIKRLRKCGVRKEDEMLTTKDVDEKLSVEDLAEALYEGLPHLANLAEKLAKQHGKASALCFFSQQNADVKFFWYNIARQLIEHASEWEENNGSACVLSENEKHKLEWLHSKMGDFR